eukprot:15465734-Alexandrium_andersonii.AAC.1
MVDRFKDEYVLKDVEDDGGAAWRHRWAPFRRIEAALQLHSPHCGDAGRLATLRLAGAIRSLGVERRRQASQTGGGAVR